MSHSVKFAPIVVFAYNRPEHTRRLWHSLRRNPEFEESPVTVYCDAASRIEHEEAVSETRSVCREMAPKRARIVEREENFGLAKSIITGVTEHVGEFGKAIIAEDDLIFSEGALRFLNESLNRYADAEQVMHVSAYMFPVQAELPEAFFYREATCWGWATWARAWKDFEPDAGMLLKKIDAGNLRSEFNVRGSAYFYEMLKKQRDGQIDSWAIRWYASMFLKGGLSLHPARSYMENLGFDGSGVHCNIDHRFVVTPTSRPVTQWPEELKESAAAVDAMVAYRDSRGFVRGRALRNAASGGPGDFPIWSLMRRSLQRLIRLAR